MYEEICLVCGKHLEDDGQAYCSEDCQNIDLTSPSISSASSALSSPHLGYAAGSEVPALVPSALGSALKNYRHNDHHSVSSSASSTSWSVLTDDDGDDARLGVGYEYAFHDSADSIYEGSSKSANFAYSMNPSALSYARRPSGTNNPSTAAHLHRRTSSGSSSCHVHGIPRSAPLHSHSSTEDDGGYSDFGFLSRDDLDMADQNDPAQAEKHSFGFAKPIATVTKSKRTRNRASLPSYFSLLQTSSPSNETRSSPMSSSSGNTLNRPSPPTPKMTLTGLTIGITQPSSITLTPSIQATPRGRRRAPGESRSSRRSGNSSSRPRSRSHARCVVADLTLRARLDSKASVEQVFDWNSGTGLTRGRAAVRRNSSPPPKMMFSVENNKAHAVARRGDSSVGDSTRRTRGRARAEELDGVGGTTIAPGYGGGRSGLLDRERTIGNRASRLL